MKLNESEFESKFKMIKNHLDNNASLNGCMFETYGKEVEYIASLAGTNTVWTYVEGEDGLYFISGMHFVNRIGYFITTKPYTEECEVNLQGN